jgi:hypothetical protein
MGWGERMKMGRLINVYGRPRLYFPAKFALLLVVEMEMKNKAVFLRFVIHARKILVFFLFIYHVV